MKQVFFALSIIFLNAVFAEQKISGCVSLSIDDAVEAANKNNITIKDGSLTLKTLKTQNKTSWNSVSPSIGLNGSLSEDFDDSAKSSIGFSGKISLVLSTNLYSNIVSAKLNYEKGLISYEQTCRQVEKDVRTTFYALLYQQEYLSLQKQSIETAKTQYETNQDKFSKGQISELDVMTSKVNYESKRPQVEQAKINLINNLATFKQVIGLEQNLYVDLVGSLDDVLKVEKVVFENLPKVDTPAPMVQTAMKQVEIEKNNVLSKRFSAYGPSINAQYSYGKSEYFDTETTRTTNSLSVGLSIPLDGYLPWSTGAVSISSAKNSLETAKLDLEDTKTSIAVQTANGLRKINQAISQIQALKENVTLAETTYDLTKTAYNYGKTDILNLQNANDAVLSAKVSLKNQAYSLASAILDLEYLLGIPYGTIK